MRSLAPSTLDRAADAAGLVVEPRGGLDVAFILRRRGSRRLVGTARLDDSGMVAARGLLSRLRSVQNAVLDVPGPLLLEQEAVLPLAAEPELSRVLRHEMDRLTPFAAEEVFWTWAVAERDKPNGRVTVRLSIVLKTAVQPLLQALARAGVAVAALEAPGPDGLTRRIGALPPGAGAARPFAVRAAGLACAGLAAASLAIPLMQQEIALEAARSQVASLAPRVALVDGLRRRLAAASNGAEQFAAVGQRAGNALQAMAAITRALPDDTYLTEFVMRDRKVTLTGRSAAAVRLIGLLSAAPELANPAFAAPVIRTIGDRGDQFTISADLAS